MMKKGVIIVAICVLIFMGLVYFFIDPSTHHMPRCPFYSLTGYLCPGCGSQRAIHSLLHLDFLKAFSFNPLMVIAIPYVALGGLLYVCNPNRPIVRWIRLNLFGLYAIWLWGVVIVVYWIGRNLY